MSRKKKKEMENVVENIQGAVLDEIMGQRYAVYAKDVIQDRAIPDARDGLKPVQRRIVFYMEKTGNTFDKPTRKCAHIVGGVMGQYHPHGDSSIYEALVRMSQPWAVREPLVDFQGNNGSMDGDGPAAFRYTEARLSALSEELVRDMDKDTVDMTLTFDDLNKEPTVLPAHFPNLFVNGAEGIAVGMATHIPPHNLREITNAMVYRLRHPDCEIDSLLKFVSGPDFPTGGKIIGRKSIEELYRTGHAHLSLLSKASIETLPNGNKQIAITEIPYGTVKSEMVYAIDKLRAEKTVPGIEEVRDETDKTGLRIAIDLKPDAKAETILNYLYGKSAGKGGIAGSYSANMVAIVDGRPKTLDLLSYCDTYLAYRREIEERRCRYDLEKNKSRLHVVEGLISAVSELDRVIAIIRRSADKADAKANLAEELAFSEVQAEAIVMMPLYKLTHTDVETLMAEKAGLDEAIKGLNELLEDKSKMDDFLAEDMKAIAKKYGTARRTEIQDEEGSISAVDARDLIVEEDCYIALSKDGYLKRSSMKSYKASGGDKGVLPGLKDGDALVYSGVAKTTDYFIAFTDLGNYVYLPVNDMKEAKWLEEGAHLNSFVSLAPGEKMVAAFSAKEFRSDLYFVLLSRRNVVKRVPLSAFPVIRKNRAVSAMRLSVGDSLVSVALTNGGSYLLVADETGFAEVYSENQIPVTNPKSGGVKAGLYNGKPLSVLLSFKPLDQGKSKALLATDLGYTRVVDLSRYPAQDRLSRGFYLYHCFKSEPHKLLRAYLLDGLEPPLTIKALLTGGKPLEIAVNDFYLTPSEKMARRPEGFVRKYPVASYYPLPGGSIPEDMPSVPLPVKEKPSVIVEEGGSPEDEDEPTFEQISLFDE